MRTYATVAAAFIALVAIGRFVDWNENVRTCKLHKCWAYLPVQSWAADLRAINVLHGTIVGMDYQLSGNLRAFLKGERVVDGEFDVPVRPSGPGRSASCVAVWRDAVQMPSELRTFLRRTMRVNVPSPAPEGAFRHYLLKSTSKAPTLYYRRLPPSPLCR